MPTFESADLHAITQGVVATLRQEAAQSGRAPGGERATTLLHTRLKAHYNRRGQRRIAEDLEWFLVSAAFGTQTVAPLFVQPGEYLLITGAALPTDGATGRFWAHIDDYVVAGEIRVADARDRAPRVYGPGDVSHIPARRAGVFSIGDHVWMLEHVRGLVPSMFTLPVLGAVFGTGDLRSLGRMVAVSTRRMLADTWGLERKPRWRNWLGNHTATPRSLRRPTCREELVAIVDEVRAHNARGDAPPRTIRAFGTSHSWSAMARNEDVMVDMRGLDRPLGVDREAGTLTVEAGMLMEDVIALAWAQGWTVPSTTAIKQISVGGLVAVGAHGTGKRHGTFSDNVVAMELVDGEGVVRRIDEREPDLLRAARIHLGCLGLVYSVTLRCEPVHRVHTVDRTLPLARFDDQAELDALVDTHDAVSVYWYPFTDDVVVKTWDPVTPEDAPPVPEYGPRHRAFDQAVQMTGQWVVGLPLAIAADTVAPSLAPVLSRLARRLFFDRDVLKTPIDAGHYFFAYTRVRVSGWAIPAHHAAAAFRAYRDLIDRYEADGQWPINVCLHMRFVGPSDALLSPAMGERTCFIEAATTENARGSQAFFEEIACTLLRDFEARPHWAKEWWLEQHPFTLGGNLAWDRFRAVRADFDPDGLFVNALIAGIDESFDECDDLGVDPTEMRARL